MATPSQPTRALHPMRVGAGLAFISASLFGAAVPLVHRFSAGAGPFRTASLLYAGAALASLGGVRARVVEASLVRGNAVRILFVALAGGVVAPACLAWGLARTNGTVGSLLLASEAFLTVVLARLFYREPVGVRVGLALACIGAGSLLVVLGQQEASPVGALGSLAVLVAALAWAADNTLTRPLADQDPRQVVLAKSAVGALLSVLLSVAAGELAPSAAHAVGLLATGALGFGVSVRVYLLAQRRIGAGRTASIFAVAPFLGAVFAWASGDGALDATTLGAAALVALGVYLHVTEGHSHGHTHEAVDHAHAHRHGKGQDGHHDHAHEPPFEGVHSHAHAHAEVTHEHAHAPDVHHQHAHET